MKNSFIISLLVCVITSAGVGFYGGMTYQSSKKSAVPAFAGRQGGTGASRGQGAGMGGRGAGGGIAAGQVLSKDANSLTVKMRDGGSKIVFYGTSTRIGKMADGSANDLAVGTEVTVMGSTNTDGSVTASTIQIRPELLPGTTTTQR